MWYRGVGGKDLHLGLIGYNPLVNLFSRSKSGKVKVAVGLSGGVDSSVAAYLLKEQRYEVVGVHMTCWDSKVEGCGPEDDRVDAVKVASKLGIKFKSVNFVKDYKKKVIKYFFDEYRAGRTPNPDVLCNKEIKFGLYLEWAMKKGFDYIATGHYARIEKENGDYKLLRGVDKGKDQSYFLYLLGQDQLSKVLFPLGGMKKEDVRGLAEEVGLHTYSKPDSVGICFIGEVDIKDFLQRKIKPKNGKVLNTRGESIGEHDGVWFYTIGQRRGFTITKYVGLPMYVVGKNVEENELIVGFAKEGLRDSFEVSDVHWIGREPKLPFEYEVRIRHLGELYKSSIAKAKYDESLEVKLVEPIFGVAPGQSAVLYRGDEVLGGGIIQ